MEASQSRSAGMAIKGLGQITETKPGAPYLAVFAAWAALNAPLVHHYLGGLATGAFFLCFLVFVLFLWTHEPGGRVLRLVLTTVVFASLLAQMVALHYIAPMFDGRMDRDSALMTWLSELTMGRYPYSAPTELNNPISVLPFMPLLAAPFHLLGDVGVLQLVSFLVLVYILWRTYKDAPRWMLASICVLATSPLLFFEVTGRSDLITNMALLLLPVYLLERQRDWQSNAGLLMLGALVGCIGATRPALAPPLFVLGLYLMRKLGTVAVLKVGVAAVIVFAGLVSPFVLWNPSVFFGYAPLGVYTTKLDSHRANLIVWPSVTAVASLVLGLAVGSPKQLYMSFAITLGLVTLVTWLSFGPDLTYLQLPFLPLLLTLPRTET